MDQQSEESVKISRSKARHLRRKRLAAARKTAEINSVLIQADTEQNSCFQGSDNILSKSKARRLRKKRRTELIEESEKTLKTENSLSETDNRTESVISNQSPTDIPEYNNYDLENSDQIQENKNPDVLLQGTSIDVIARSEIKSNRNKDSNNSLFETDLKISEILLDEENPHCGSSISSRISDFKSNQLSNNTEVIKDKDKVESERKKEKENKLEGGLNDLDIKSSNLIKTTTLDSLKGHLSSDDELGSSNSNSSSNLTERYEINTIEPHDSLGLITRTVKTVLNTTELIENEKNLKISNSSSNSNSNFHTNSTVIDLTNYSRSDFIINTDSISCSLEEQQIILDFISDSSSDIAENSTLFYNTNQQEITNTELHNKNKIHNKSVTGNFNTSKNQSSFDIIKDYSLPSTSVNYSIPTAIESLKDSIENNTVEDPNHSYALNKAEGKMNSTEKTREQIKAEREAKKAAKALAKGKTKAATSDEKKDAKISKDGAIKVAASSSEQSRKDIKQNVVVKREAAPKEEKKIVKTESEISPSIDDKENESQIKVDGKSKRESKAERRAKQEAQRAAKEKLASEKNKPKSVLPTKIKPLQKIIDTGKTVVRKTLVDNDNLHEVKLFKHLYHERELSLVNFPTLNSNIHPAIMRLGVQYANKVIVGSNARCVALLAAVKQLVRDFERPSQADFTRGLEASLQECAAYLHHCRPMAVSMQNALKHLKWQMSQLPTTVSDNDAKSKLGDAIDTYIREQIELAGKAISNTIQSKISNGDVILTYAFSSLIHNILIDAHIAGKQFRVIVVDGRPWLEGKEQLRRLAKHGIECSYILINALSFIMPEVSKVFLGAHAILANGAVMSRAGTAQVALMAKAFNVPVLVACETHKSCERVQTDSFVYNEIGDADELARNFFSNSKKSSLVNWKTKKSLDLLNITFDVTPADLVSAVVTELAILPCTSIPVILRIKPSEI